MKRLFQIELNDAVVFNGQRLAFHNEYILHENGAFYSPEGQRLVGDAIADGPNGAVLIPVRRLASAMQFRPEETDLRFLFPGDPEFSGRGDGGIRALVYDDSRRFEIELDATLWLMHADDETLIKLHRKDYSRCEAADSVAEYFERLNPRVAQFFAQKGEYGFEVEIDSEAAQSWLRDNNPVLLSRMLEAAAHV
jgi:hypothetical protein